MALFGTDGIRGLANGHTLTAEIALDVAVAAAHIMVESSSNKGKRPFAIVGQDSRASGEFLEAAVAAGLASAGVDVVRVGVLWPLAQSDLPLLGSSGLPPTFTSLPSMT